MVVTVAAARDKVGSTAAEMEGAAAVWAVAEKAEFEVAAARAAGGTVEMMAAMAIEAGLMVGVADLVAAGIQCECRCRSRLHSC